jgi:hypothetical protein
MHDIYDPPPAPVPWNPPAAPPLRLERSDLVFLAGVVIMLAFAAGVASALEPALVVLIALGGSLVILESWYTALGFLHREPPQSSVRRWMIFVAALVPWLVGLGIAALLMSGLFLLSDWLSS